MWSKQLDQCIRLNSLGQQEAHWEIQRSFFKSRLSAWAYCTIIEELKAVLSMVTGLEPREQRLLFSGKEREDGDHLHMVGVRDMDKVLLLEDPALKDMKLRATLAAQTAQSPYRPFIKV